MEEVLAFFSSRSSKKTVGKHKIDASVVSDLSGRAQSVYRVLSNEMIDGDGSDASGASSSASETHN